MAGDIGVYDQYPKDGRSSDFQGQEKVEKDNRWRDLALNLIHVDLLEQVNEIVQCRCRHERSGPDVLDREGSATYLGLQLCKYRTRTDLNSILYSPLR